MIQVKGVNDYLLFVLNDEVHEDELLTKLKNLLLTPSFQRKNFYPKAYFDFGKREVTYELFWKLLIVLEECESVVFCGLSRKKVQKQYLSHIKKTIRNGEIYIQNEDCLFEGRINPGGLLIVYGDLYLLGASSGTIHLIGENVTLSASHLSHATIEINHCRLDDVNIDAMTVFYSEDNEMKMRVEEEVYG